MALISYKAKAPGTLMLCGEHAVLQNKHAIVFAIDKWIKITLKQRKDRRVIILSTLGTLESNLDSIQIQKPFEFILAAILHFKGQMELGFELSIDSEFREDVGLGSSAAVTVAVIAVLSQFISAGEGEKQERFLFETAKTIIRTVQGVGSGADVAASVYGGVIQYKPEAPYLVRQWSFLFPLTVVYSGFKTPTPEVINKVEILRKKHPEVFKALYEAIDYSVNDAAQQIEKKDWQRLGEILNIQQGMMSALGVGTELLNQIIDKLNKDPNIYGAKISGSGLGDCIIAIGNKNGVGVPFKIMGTDVKQIPLSVSLLGVQYE